MSIEIENNIIIDEDEELLASLNMISKIQIKNLDTVISFIKNEYHTKFYIDATLTCMMEESSKSVYVWLDTGLRDRNGSTIFISLLKTNGIYTGHYVGTIERLSSDMRNYYKQYKNKIYGNVSKFKRKYLSRTSKRKIQYITNENEYLRYLQKAEVAKQDIKKLSSEKSGEEIADFSETEEEERISKSRFINGNKIILDLEFCRVDEDNKIMKKLSKFETIQFGAVKLDADNEIIGRYESYVKPRYGHVDNKVQSLTGITDNALISSPDFIEVINGFLDWAGGTTTILSWSLEDLRVLRAESNQKGFEDERLTAMFENWIDLQEDFGIELGVKHQIALKDAVNGVGRQFAGAEHSAIDDAENTAFVFQEMLATDFKEKFKDMLDLFRPSNELTFSLGSLFGDLMSQLETVD